MTNRQRLHSLWKFCDIAHLYEDDPLPQEAVDSIVEYMYKLDKEVIRLWADARLRSLECRLTKEFGYNRDSARDVINNVKVYLDRHPVPREILRRRIVERKAA